MTPAEFKSWFDGFTEAMTGTPTKAQWARIQARVAEIDGRETTHTVYVNRYLNDYYHHYRPYWSAMGVGVNTLTGAVGSDYKTMLSSAQGAIGSGGDGFNSRAAMTALGKADAMSLAAA